MGEKIFFLLFGLVGVAMVAALIWAESRRSRMGGMALSRAHLAVRGGSGALLVAVIFLLTWATAFPPRSLKGMAWLITGIVASIFLLLVLAVLDARMVRRAGRRRREELLSALKEVLKGRGGREEER